VEYDNAFTIGDVFEFFKKRNIKLEPLALRIQSQNGGAERLGGVITECARAIQGKLPIAL
jgi:hypothetical protein